MTTSKASPPSIFLTRRLDAPQVKTSRSPVAFSNCGTSSTTAALIPFEAKTVISAACVVVALPRKKARPAIAAETICFMAQPFADAFDAMTLKKYIALKWPDVRFGPEVDIPRCKRRVRFPLTSGSVGLPRAIRRASRLEAYLQSARQALSHCLQYAEDAWHAERCLEHCSGQLTARPLSTAIAGNENCISTRTASAASVDLAIETCSNSVGWRNRLPAAGGDPDRAGAYSVPAELEYAPASLIWRMFLSANRAQIRGLQAKWILWCALDRRRAATPSANPFLNPHNF